MIPLLGESGKFQHRVMAETHWAGGAGNNVADINIILAVGEEIVLSTRHGRTRGFQAQVKRSFTLLCFQRFKVPAGICCFAVDRMIFSRKSFGVSPKRHTEEITTKDFEDRRQRGIQTFLRPWGDRIRLNSAVLPVKCDWTDVTAGPSDEDFDLVGSDLPGGLPVNDAQPRLAEERHGPVSSRLDQSKREAVRLAPGSKAWVADACQVRRREEGPPGRSTSGTAGIRRLAAAIGWWRAGGRSASVRPGHRGPQVRQDHPGRDL